MAKRKQEVVEQAPEVWEPRVWHTAQNHHAIEVYRGTRWVTFIQMDTEVDVSRKIIADFEWEYSPVDYPVGRAAARFLNSVTGVLSLSNRARAILEIIMKTYLVSFTGNKTKVTRFADEDAATAAAKGKKGVSIINKDNFIQAPDTLLNKLGKALKVTVDPKDKEKARKEILAILENTQMDAPKATAGRKGLPDVPLTDELSEKIKKFLVSQGDKDFKDVLKAGTAAGFKRKHVRAVKKTLRNESSAERAAAKAAKAAAKAEKAKAAPKAAKKPDPKAAKKKPAAKKPTTKKK